MNRAVRDRLERVARTFVQAFAAALAGSELIGDWSVWSSAATAGLAAAVAALMGVTVGPFAARPEGATARPVVVPEPVEPVLTGQPVVFQEVP